MQLILVIILLSTTFTLQSNPSIHEYITPAKPFNYHPLVSFENPLLTQPRDPSSLQGVSELPFTIYGYPLNDTLGFEIWIKMKDWAREWVKDIKVGAQFPPCETIFQIYLDLTDWEGRIGKKYFNNMKLDTPRICLSDWGVNVPFTMICFYISDLTILPRGVSGKITADVAIGVSRFQYKETGIELYNFRFGETSDCFKYKSPDECAGAEGGKCGWCVESKQCLPAREDKKADVCKICHRCSFFMKGKASKDECVSKQSCGWCDIDGTCRPGDDLGPMDYTKCEDANMWHFELKTYPGELKKTGFLGGFTGFLAGVATTTVLGLVIIITVWIVRLRKKSLGQESRPLAYE